MALNTFGIYCKFAINSESKAVLSFSVKCQSNKTGISVSPPGSCKITFHIDVDVTVAVEGSAALDVAGEG